MNSYNAIIMGTVLAGFGVAKAQYAGVRSQLLQSRDGTNDHQHFHERIDTTTENTTCQSKVFEPCHPQAKLGEKEETF